MKHTIAILPGDGIGPEVMEQTLRVLDAVGKKFGHTFTYRHGLIGGGAYDRFGVHFPEETKEICRGSEAILFAATGGPVSELHLPKWHNCEPNSILALRKEFHFSAALRPVRVFPELEDISPLKPELIERGIDILFVRELVGDCYFGEHKNFERDGKRAAMDVSEYTEDQVAAAAHIAFQAARKRKKRVTSVDKANVLWTSRLWREVMREVAREYPDVELGEMLVDNCAMQLIRNPSEFDVVVTTNMFGDILSDAGAVLPGSLGLLASASVNDKGFGLYEPPGGSAPDIAGKGIANPIGQILSAAMMLKFSFSLQEEAEAIERAVEEALRAGYRTADIKQAGKQLVGTVKMTDAIVSAL